MLNRSLIIVLIALCLFSFRANAQFTQSGPATQVTKPSDINGNNTVQVKKEKDIWVADYYFNGLTLNIPQETTTVTVDKAYSTTKKAKVEIRRLSGQSKTLVTVKLNNQVERAFTIEQNDDNDKTIVFYIDKVNGKEIKVEFRNLEMKDSRNQYTCYIWTKRHNLLNKEKEVLTFPTSKNTYSPIIRTAKVKESVPFKIGVRVNCIEGCLTTATTPFQTKVAYFYIKGNDIYSEMFGLYGNEQNKEFFALVNIKPSYIYDSQNYTIEFSEGIANELSFKFEVEVFSAEAIEDLTNE